MSSADTRILKTPYAMNMTTSNSDFDSQLNHSKQVSSDWQQASYLAYATVMFTILTIGFLGNVLTVFVLCQPSLRKQALAPLMLSLAFGDLFLIVFGYPTMMSVVLPRRDISVHRVQCSWYAFVNGAVGITTIATFTAMTIVLSYSLHQMNPRFRVSNKCIFHLIALSWFCGVVLMLPPLLGWSRFVPGAAGIGCGPDWTDVSPAGMAYSLLLIVVGFFGPILAIAISYFKICRLLRRDIVTGNNRIRLRRRRWQMKLLRLTATAIAAFMLSWSPYCLVSMISMFRGNNVLAPGEAEVPALMAKASAIYNPIVYTVMNRRFRMTLSISVCCKSPKTVLYPTTLGSSRQPEQCRTKSYTITSRLSA